MPNLKTEITEIVTGLGMFDFVSIEAALNQPPRSFVGVGPDVWERLRNALESDDYSYEFRSAWENGRFFRNALDGLRGRRPSRIEWKGPNHQPGYEFLPIDLRVDHVYLISCKYLSRVLLNSSPMNLFEHLLERRDRNHEDWYNRVVPELYHSLYGAARMYLLGIGFSSHLPVWMEHRSENERREMKKVLANVWPESLRPCAEAFAAAVSRRTVSEWEKAICSPPDRERLLWRMLRLGSAPYFILGSSKRKDALRLRVATPWDWRADFEMLSLDFQSRESLQPLVGWHAIAKSKATGEEIEFDGHVEIRWSHGKFNGAPEAKLYLDTPHANVPGYYPLV